MSVLFLSHYQAMWQTCVVLSTPQIRVRSMLCAGHQDEPCDMIIANSAVCPLIHFVTSCNKHVKVGLSSLFPSSNIIVIIGGSFMRGIKSQTCLLPSHWPNYFTNLYFQTLIPKGDVVVGCSGQRFHLRVQAALGSWW